MVSETYLKYKSDLPYNCINKWMYCLMYSNYFVITRYIDKKKLLYYN